jgi:septum formation protein
MSEPCIYLASQSPRRAELLRQIGLHYEMIRVWVNEAPLPGEAVEAYVTRLACAKVEAARGMPGRRPLLPILGADTAVALEGEVLGKPRDRHAALEMLTRLSGRTHRVLSAVALQANGSVATSLSASRVRFRAIEPGEIAAYWDTGEPADKAGAYAIQGYGAVFVERLEGSYSGVMGLPLYETAQLLHAVGVEVLAGDKRGT